MSDNIDNLIDEIINKADEIDAKIEVIDEDGNKTGVSESDEKIIKKALDSIQDKAKATKNNKKGKLGA